MASQRSQAQIDADLRQAQNSLNGLSARVAVLEAAHATLLAEHKALHMRFEALVEHYVHVTEKANHAHLFACGVNREGQPLRPEYGEPMSPEHMVPIPYFERAPAHHHHLSPVTLPEGT